MYTPSHSPLPTNITWRRPSTAQVILLHDNAQLRVIAAQLENAGTYTCVVAGLGERSATLTVRGQYLLPPGLLLFFCVCFACAFSISAYTCVSLITLLSPSLPSSLSPFLFLSLPPLQKAQ